MGNKQSAFITPITDGRSDAVILFGVIVNYSGVHLHFDKFQCRYIPNLTTNTFPRSSFPFDRLVLSVDFSRC